MNMACVQFGLTPEEAWLGVTRHAAQALNRQHSHGQLAAGFQANFAVWDAEKPVEIIYELGETLCISEFIKVTQLQNLTRTHNEPLATHGH